MFKPAATTYRFDQFQLDVIRRVLLRDERPVQLPSRALDVLLALVEHSQTVLNKDELMRLVWGDRIVEENNLTRHISTLRRVLDEGPNDHRYIVTVPGQGYSFVASVERGQTNGWQTEPVKQNGNHTSGLIDTGSLHSSPTGFEPTRIDTGLPVKPYGDAGALERPATYRRWLLAGALVILAGVVGWVAYNFVAAKAKPAAIKTYRDWDVFPLTKSGGSVTPDISRDGKYAAYVSSEAGQQSVWILQIATSARHQIVPPEKFAYFNLFFTPDGSELYFTRKEGAEPLTSLYRIPVLGGVPTKLRDDLHTHAVTSPDGSHLGFSRRNGDGKLEFVIANRDGTEERVLATHDLPFAAWSSDGRAIAYSVGNAESGAERMGINEIRVADGTEREVCQRKWVHVSFKSWLEDGTGLIICARDQSTPASRLWFVSYPSGEVRPLSNEFDSFKHARLTADASMLVAEQVGVVSDVWSGALTDSANAKKIGVWGKEGISLAPDGRIVFPAIQTGQISKIWIMNADGTDRRQLTTDNSQDICAVVSPDGRYIVFASDRSGNFEIWRMNIDGSNPLQLTHGKGANPPSITPDSRWVIYLSSEDSCLYKVPIGGGQPARVVDNAVGYSAVSPDGRLIAYFAKGKSSWEIAVTSFHDGSRVMTFDAGPYSLNNTSLKWTPDGKALLFSKSSGGVANVWRQPLDRSPAKQVTDFQADGIFRFDVSADGKTLVCSRGGYRHDIVLIKNLR